MGDGKGEQCTGEGVPELSESKSGVLWTAYEADIIWVADVLCGEGEVGTRTVRTDQLEGVAETAGAVDIKEAEVLGVDCRADLGYDDLV